MAKYSKKSAVSLVKTLELVGKPAYFLFSAIIVGIFYYIRLITLFGTKIAHLLQKIRFPSITFPKISLPKLKLHFPKPSRKKSRQKTRKKTTKLPTFSIKQLRIFLIIAFLGSSSFCIYYYVLKDLPQVTTLRDSPPSLSTKINDRNGILLYQIYKDENRSLIPLKELPKYVIDATISAEDKNFYHHHGVDPLGIIRAFFNNITKGTSQGGSTITQQLIKNTLLSPEKTFLRKLKELVLAIETENHYTKDQILEMYLNQVGYGGTAYGIEEASWQYFGKSARYLTISESALLAGLPISPTVLSPWGSSPYLGKIRQQQVLESMVETGSITENDKIEALSTPLSFHPQGNSIKAPHFVMYIKDLLVKKYGETMVARGGLTVTTSLDLSIQKILENEISTELKKLEKLHVQNGAGLVVNPKTGEILAMAGSHDFYDSKHDGQVNLVIQQRQPGSSIKPITYALALSNGLSPSSTIDDTPICFVLKGQPNYCPKNYDGKFHGKVTLRTALGSSYNIPAIKLLNTYGIKNMIELAKRMGITTWEDSSRYGLSLTLGGGEVTMLDLASAYAVFANNGSKVPYQPMLSVKNSSGTQLLSKPELTSIPIIDPAVAYQINSILSDSLARSPAFGFNSILNLPGKNVAVKTGTTNNLRDNWTFGYTKDILVATWVGNNDNTSMSSVASGITGASPIWAHTMKKILEGVNVEPFEQPSNIVRVNISCSPTPKYESFIKGLEPRINCTKPEGAILPVAATTSQ